LPPHAAGQDASRDRRQSAALHQLPGLDTTPSSLASPLFFSPRVTLQSAVLMLLVMVLGLDRCCSRDHIEMTQAGSMEPDPMDFSRWYLLSYFSLACKFHYLTIFVDEL